MAWDKDTVIIWLASSTTGALDTGAHTVKVQPIDQSYPTGAIDCSQLSSEYAYKPDSDLDEDTHYDVYVDGSKLKRLIATNSTPMIGV